jgi:hypothetical protein
MLANRIAYVVSRRVGLLALGGAFAVLLGLSSGCNTGGGGPVNVPLEFRPTHAEPISGTITATDVKVHLEPVVDKRQNKDQIGQNVEDEAKPPVPVYSSGKSPAEFVHDVLETELKSFGIELTEAAEAADRIVTVDLTKFWAEEGNNYNAEVSGVAQVRDKGGRVKWKGPIGGNGKTFGRSLSPTNYNECLSDATRRTVGALLNNPKFQEALAR